MTIATPTNPSVGTNVHSRMQEAVQNIEARLVSELDSAKTPAEEDAVGLKYAKATLARIGEYLIELAADFDLDKDADVLDAVGELGLFCAMRASQEKE